MPMGTGIIKYTRKEDIKRFINPIRHIGDPFFIQICSGTTYMQVNFCDNSYYTWVIVCISCIRSTSKK